MSSRSLSAHPRTPAPAAQSESASTAAATPAGPAADAPRTDPLTLLVAEVLGVPRAELSERSGPGVHDAWTSLKHVELVVALEERFGVALSSREIRRITGLGGLRELLAAKGVAEVAA